MNPFLRRLRATILMVKEESLTKKRLRLSMADSFRYSVYGPSKKSR